MPKLVQQQVLRALCSGGTIPCCSECFADERQPKCDNDERISETVRSSLGSALSCRLQENVEQRGAWCGCEHARSAVEHHGSYEKKLGCPVPSSTKQSPTSTAVAPYRIAAGCGRDGRKLRIESTWINLRSSVGSGQMYRVNGTKWKVTSRIAHEQSGSAEQPRDPLGSGRTPCTDLLTKKWLG